MRSPARTLAHILAASQAGWPVPDPMPPARPDCCDGSDEGSGLCANTCAEAGAAARAALRERAAAEAAGAAVRAGYVQQAQERLRLWADEDAQLTVDIAQAKRQEGAWKGEPAPHLAAACHTRSLTGEHWAPGRGAVRGAAKKEVVERREAVQQFRL